MQEKNEKRWENGGGKNYKHKHFDPRQLAAWNDRIAQIAVELAELKSRPRDGGKKAKQELEKERRYLRKKIDDHGTEDARRAKGFQNPNQR